MTRAMSVMSSTQRMAWLLGTDVVPDVALRHTVADIYAKQMLSALESPSFSLPSAIRSLLAPFQQDRPDLCLHIDDPHDGMSCSLATQRVLFWGIAELVLEVLIGMPQRLTITFRGGTVPFIHVESTRFWSYDDVAWNCLCSDLLKQGVVIRGHGVSPYTAYVLIPLIHACEVLP